MAQPIVYETPARDAREELAVRLAEAPLEHAEAVLAAYKLLEELHRQDVLEIARGALAAKNEIIKTLVEGARSPEVVKGLRNGIVLAKALGAVEPEALDGLARSMAEALNHMKSEPDVPGLLGLWKHFRSKELRRGVVFVNALLEAMGRNLGRGKKK